MWGIAVAANGEIFVADTWNGRIEVFDGQGQFLRKWGYFNTTNGELGDPLAMFGPRGIALDPQGNLLVADTGNKRILHFTPTGEALNQVGGGGVVGGRFEEPVGVAVDPRDGSVFVADAWNRRIQKLAPDLSFVAEYAVPGWESDQIFHKPYVAVAPNGDIYASDPEMFRVYAYAPDGALKAAFGNYGADMTQISLPTGLAVDAASNSILVADADNGRVMVFPLLP
ncbi:MAG: NHL repeat-containing protein [Caldilineaceae bacterium]